LHQNQVQRAMAIVDACLLQFPITLPKIASIAVEAGASPFHLHRLFLAAVGETPIEYFNKRRLEIAAVALETDGNANLLELALNVGFESHAAFTTAFKKRFGATPSQFSKEPLRKPFKSGGPRHFLAAGASPPKDTEVCVEEKPAFSFGYRSETGVRDGQFFANAAVPEQLSELVQSNRSVAILPAASFPVSPERLNQNDVEGHFGGIVFEDELANWSEQIRHFEPTRWFIQRHHGDFRFLHQSWNLAYQQLLGQELLELGDQWPLEVYLQSPVDLDVLRPSAEIWLPLK